ncbi:hypothetical protein E8E13_003836 [Curvularia kusanoi]|uniref:CFEM domain-containing protein n=1 Tax=Curvularia kusanoi TaxID=90978 RepID=A0A9P4TI98_CURKU|nr:hypothetical protein E8E13_003836 [Curvularia kusanoi]
MRFSTIAAFAASLAVVSAQTPDLSSVPNCAVSCLVAAVPGSGCGVTDVKCQCTTGQQALTDSLMKCIPTKCSADDAAKVPAALAGICNSAGYPVSIPASAAATGASSAAASAASSAASMVSSMASKASSAASSATGSAASRASGAASATSSGPAQSTGGAAANAVGLGAVALGMVAALF